ncbi:MAG: sulfatase-like hydrolase/transferase [Verrucomicrobiota bacterium]
MKLLLTLITVTCALAAQPHLGQATNARPAQTLNVIIIYTDDQGSIDANCYGSDDLFTPNIDRLAASGVRFSQMLAPSGICSASRAGLMTGRFPARAGVPGNVSSAQGEPGMPTEQLTIAELLKTNGYTTHHVGKWHLGYTPETMPLGQGFDTSFGHMGGCIDNYSHFFYWVGPNRHDLWRDGEEVWHDGEYFGDLMVDEMLKIIDDGKENDAPFFVYWAINWPHYPLQGTDQFRQHYASLDLEHPRDKYAIFMSSMDALIGTVLDHLDATGQRDNTLIIFQSDHGHSVEERTFYGGGSSGPYRGHKGTVFEGGLRVPSIVSLPGTIPSGVVRDQLVTGCDWFPTIAELTQTEVPADHQLDGQSIVAILKSDNAKSPHENFYWHMGKNAAKAKWAVREGDWKLIGNAHENVTPEGVAELTADDKKLFLVNLADDIGETTNLAADHPEIVEKLSALRQQHADDIANSLED